MAKHKDRLVLKVEMDLAWDDEDFARKPTVKGIKRTVISELKYTLKELYSVRKAKIGETT